MELLLSALAYVVIAATMILGRGHRINIFDPAYKTIGVGFAQHAVYQSMMVNLMCVDEIAE